jgi:hypothetical protein
VRSLPLHPTARRKAKRAREGHPQIPLAEIFSASQAGIAVNCRYAGGIVQRPAQALVTPTLRLRWSWRIDVLPSWLPEDTVLTHDYLSVAPHRDQRHGPWAPRPQNTKAPWRRSMRRRSLLSSSRLVRRRSHRRRCARTVGSPTGAPTCALFGRTAPSGLSSSTESAPLTSRCQRLVVGARAPIPPARPRVSSRGSRVVAHRYGLACGDQRAGGSARARCRASLPRTWGSSGPSALSCLASALR